MLRLLQGDVGSGKTIVAVFALIQVAENNFQTAVMAPTEILARQHLQNFTNYLSPLGIQIAFLSGSQNTQERKDNLSLIENGKAKVIIGTHALFQENVYFDDLALVIIDEQHKFGVHQRLSLSKKANVTPHQLVMTATPIPRSLTMSAYADLDTSIIDELPPGRQTIETVALSNARRDELIEKIKQISKEGRQIYWVCTLIEESEALRAESAEKTFAYLSDNLKDLKVVMIHGRLTKLEKEIQDAGHDTFINGLFIAIGGGTQEAGTLYLKSITADEKTHGAVIDDYFAGASWGNAYLQATSLIDEVVNDQFEVCEQFYTAE